jgi:hypothetical protein
VDADTNTRDAHTRRAGSALPCFFRDVFLKDYCRFASAQK